MYMEDVEEKITAQARMATAFSPGFAGLAQQMQELIRPALEAVRKIMEHIQEMVRDFIEHIIKPVVYALSWWRPIYYAPAPRKTHVHEDDSGGYLSIDTDEYGYFVIGGKTINYFHSKNSACGRLLKRLLLTRAKIVSYDELKEVICSADRKIVFRDLKSQLRKQGFKLQYKLVRSEGIAMLGVTPLQ